MLRLPFRLGSFIWLAPWLVLGICAALTLLVTESVRRNEQRAAQTAFDAAVQDMHSRINIRLSNYANLLKGAAGLFAASEHVERREFSEYVEMMQLRQGYPGIQGLGYTVVVAHRDRQKLVAQMRREGMSRFELRADDGKEETTAIIYLEPMDWRNQRAIGFDMYAEPIRRAAMERARDSDAPVMTGKVTLVQETDRDVQSGFLMYLPVYRNHLPHDTPALRRNNLQGWVYEPFRMKDLMTRGVLGSFLRSVNEQLDVEIYDGATTQPAALMFDSHLPRTDEDGGRTAAFVSVQTVAHFGHEWTIVIRSLPAFEDKVLSGRSYLALAGGLAVSVLLTLVVWLLYTTNLRALHLAERMSSRLGRALTETISAISALSEMRDPYTAGHQQRAAELARAIGLEMGLKGDQLQALNFAALIYEIGKIQVPAEILSKPAKLDEVEYRLMQTHAENGAEVLREIDFPWPVAQIVLQHHERMDGSGYPFGLKGDEIMLEARIIAVADVVEAMCSYRPYRMAPGVDAALQEIASGRGTLYDAEVVDACVRLFRERGFAFLNETSGMDRRS